MQFQNPSNLEMCIEVLSQESERMLYGEERDVVDSPVRGHLTANDPFAEPLSIKIPETPHGPVLYQPTVRPATHGQPSSMNPVASHVSGNQNERQPSVDEYNQGIGWCTHIERL